MTYCTYCGTKREGKYCGGCGKALPISNAEVETSGKGATEGQFRPKPKFLGISLTLNMIGAILLTIGVGYLGSQGKVGAIAYETAYGIAYQEEKGRQDNNFTEDLRRFGMSDRGIAQAKKDVNRYWMSSGGYDGDIVRIAESAGEKARDAARKSRRNNGITLLVVGTTFLLLGILLIWIK